MFNINIPKSGLAVPLTKVLGIAALAATLSSGALAGSRDSYISIKSDIAKMSRNLKPRLRMAEQNPNVPAVCAVILSEEIEALSKMNRDLKFGNKAGFRVALKDAQLGMGDLSIAGCASTVEKLQLNLHMIGVDFDSYMQANSQGVSQ